MVKQVLIEQQWMIKRQGNKSDTWHFLWPSNADVDKENYFSQRVSSCHKNCNVCFNLKIWMLFILGISILSFSDVLWCMHFLWRFISNNLAFSKVESSENFRLSIDFMYSRKMWWENVLMDLIFSYVQLVKKIFSFLLRTKLMDIHHHHHHVVLVARISLTLSRHFSLSFIASGKSSGQHPISSHSCWMYVRAGRPAFARPCVGVHKSTSLTSSFLLLQQCPACLVRPTWIVFVIGGRWPYSWCLVACCRQDLFKIARSILV